MRPLEESAYLAMRQSAEVIEEDRFGEKVLRLPDGSYLKLFRRKRLLTSAALYPYAQRFADNAATLAKLGIPCPEVIATYRIPSIARDAVHYSPLPGWTLRQLLEAKERQPELQITLGTFIARLHDSGIYFRSLHLGNVVDTPSGELGLIDIADLKVQEQPLPTSRRLRNFQHIFRYPGDRAWIKAQVSAFACAYDKASRTESGITERKIVQLLDANERAKR